MRGLPSLGPRGEGWVAGQLTLAFLIATSASRGPAWKGPARVATTAAGLPLIVAGALLALAGARGLGRSLTAMPQPRPSGELVDSGVYAHVRHPIYAGLILVAAGWGLATASSRALALTPLTAAFLWLKSQREEAWLSDRFEGYEAYRRRTPGLIPRLG